jgi:hypothetical protein
MNKNILLALILALVAGSVGASVFWWRFRHKLPPMPQGSVYGQAYLPVPLAQPISTTVQPSATAPTPHDQ